MKNIIIGFIFAILLVIASFNGNYALFDALPFGGWSFLILYFTFHLTFLACASAKNSMGESANKRFSSGILIYWFIFVGGLPLSVCLMSWFKWGWITVLGNLLCLAYSYLLIRRGGYLKLKVPETLLSEKRTLWIQIAWSAGFCMVVLIAKSFDLLNGDFDASGARLLAYNAVRLSFILYLGLALFQIGLWILKLGWKLSGGIPTTIHTLDRIILCTIFGGALATLIMFILGLLHLYYTWLVFFIALPVVWSSSQWLVPATENLFSEINLFFRNKNFSQAFPSCLLFSALWVGIALTLVVKGLWPGGAGGDVYSHYLPYYREVIAKHGLEPNAVWYHYYISKGAGLFFLAMLLVDDLGPQLVTLAFHFVSAAIVYDLVTRATKIRIAGLFAVVILLYVYIPIRTWGIFLKHHDLMGCGLLFAVWFAIFLGRQKSLHWRNYVIGGIIFSTAFSLQFPTATALLASFFAASALWFYITRRFQAARSSILFSVVSVVSVSTLIVFNQLQSGLGMETPTRVFWKFANQQKFSHWVSPYLMTYLNEGSSSGVGSIALPFVKLSNFSELIKLLRIEYLGVIYPSFFILILIAIILIAVACIVEYRRRQNNPLITVIVLAGLAWIISFFIEHPISARQQVVFIGILLIFFTALYYPSFNVYVQRLVRHQTLLDSGALLFCLTALTWIMANIVAQPVSIYRMFSFLCAISIVVGISVWTLLLISLRRHLLFNVRVRKIFTVGLAFLVVNIVCSSALSGMRPNIHPWLKFALGINSAQYALSKTVDPYSKDPSVWPPYIQARQLVGFHSPILTFGNNGNLIGTSFSFPGSGLQNEVSYSLGPNWHKIVFENPATAEQELKKLNINYFLIDWCYEYLFGGLPFSPLFNPSELTKRFSLVSNYNGVWLLCWKEIGGKELSANDVTTWDLVRNGYIDPLLDSRIANTLSSKFTDLIDEEKIMHPNFWMWMSSNYFTEIADKLTNEVRLVLPQFLLPTTREVIIQGLQENLVKSMRKFCIKKMDNKQDDDTNWLQEITAALSTATIETISNNIKDHFHLLLNYENHEQCELSFHELRNNSVVTKRMSDLYQVVREIYVYNGGNTSNVLRKPGLYHTPGWQ